MAEEYRKKLVVKDLLDSKLKYEVSESEIEKYYKANTKELKFPLTSRRELQMQCKILLESFAR